MALVGAIDMELDKVEELLTEKSETASNINKFSLPIFPVLNGSVNLTTNKL